MARTETKLIGDDRDAVEIEANDGTRFYCVPATFFEVRVEPGDQEMRVAIGVGGRPPVGLYIHLNASQAHALMDVISNALEPIPAGLAFTDPREIN